MKSEKRTRQTFKSTFGFAQPHNPTTPRPQPSRTQTPRPQPTRPEERVQRQPSTQAETGVYLSLSSSPTALLSCSPPPLCLPLSLLVIRCLALSVSQYTTLRCLWLVKDYCYHQPGRYANRTGSRVPPSPPSLLPPPIERVPCNCRPTEDLLPLCFSFSCFLLLPPAAACFGFGFIFRFRSLCSIGFNL